LVLEKLKLNGWLTKKKNTPRPCFTFSHFQFDALWRVYLKTDNLIPSTTIFCIMYHNGMNSAIIVTAGLFKFMSFFSSYKNITFHFHLVYLRLVFFMNTTRA